MFQESWGGLIETLESCEEKDNLPDNIKILIEKIKVLDSSKNVKEIRNGIAFTEKERNYLNSPLLDEIYFTVFSRHPFFQSLLFGKVIAANFYAKRMKKISVHYLITSWEKRGYLQNNYNKTPRIEGVIKSIKFLLENKYRVDVTDFIFFRTGVSPIVIEFLLENNRAFTNNDFWFLCEHEMNKTVEKLIEKIPENDKELFNSSTFLDNAIRRNNLELAEILLKNGLYRLPVRIYDNKTSEIVRQKYNIRYSTV